MGVVMQVLFGCQYQDDFVVEGDFFVIEYQVVVGGVYGGVVVGEDVDVFVYFGVFLGFELEGLWILVVGIGVFDGYLWLFGQYCLGYEQFQYDLFCRFWYLCCFVIF